MIDALCVHRFDSPLGTVVSILGEDVAKRVKPIWGLDEEGELRTAWRDTGVPNFWFMMGNLMWCRFHSKHLALREFLCPCFSVVFSAFCFVPFDEEGKLIVIGRLSLRCASLLAHIQRSRPSRRVCWAAAATSTATSESRRNVLTVAIRTWVPRIVLWRLGCDLLRWA